LNQAKNQFFSENEYQEFAINILPKIVDGFGGKVLMVDFKLAHIQQDLLVYRIEFFYQGNYR
jgi:hypothetical protein